MAMLPMSLLPGDYAAREAARHSRSLAEHLLEADPMARPATAARHPPVNSPSRATASPHTRHGHPSAVLTRCGGLPSPSSGA